MRKQLIITSGHVFPVDEELLHFFAVETDLAIWIQGETFHMCQKILYLFDFRSQVL